MANRKLQNYLRSYRKRAGLSQDDVAYLLGCVDGGKVSRYERFKREPNLQTALACEIIFNLPVREIFAGIFEKVERRVVRRIGNLGRKLSAKNGGRVTDRKLEALGEALRGLRISKEKK